MCYQMLLSHYNVTIQVQIHVRVFSNLNIIDFTSINLSPPLFCS